MARSRFIGSRDSNAIILKNIFPVDEVLIATPFVHKDTSYREEFDVAVFESASDKTLRTLESKSDLLLERGWRQGSPVFDGESELWFFRERGAHSHALVTLEVFELWHILSRDFVVSNLTRLLVVKEGGVRLETDCILARTDSAVNQIMLPELEKARLRELVKEVN